MTKRVLHKSGPFVIICRRRDISLPIKYRFFTTCHLFRHKSQLDKRLQIKIPVRIHHLIKVRKIVLLDDTSVRLFALLINCHIFTKQSMTADIIKPNLFLHKGKLIQIFFM